MNDSALSNSNRLDFGCNTSFCYVDGRWEQLTIDEINYYKNINPKDWQLARLNETNHKYYCAVQTIARQEERYLKEWIEYHLSLGIDFIYIYDNNDEDGLDDFLRTVLNKDDYNKIEVIPWHEPMEFQQFAALEDCINKHKFDIKWLLTIDVDEFLALEMSLCDFLEEFKYASEIYLSWQSFNANGQLYYEDKPVMERFTETYFCRDGGGQGKIFFRPTRLNNWGIHSATIILGLGTFAGLNQLINATYYTFFASSNSTIANNSYNFGYLTRWERLDYTKTQLGSNSVFGFWARQYYGEYSLHMYGYFLFPYIESFKKADVTRYSFDIEHGFLISTGINVVSYLIGLFGF